VKKKLLVGGGVAVVIAVVVLANLRGQKGDLSVDTVVIGHEDLVAEVNCSGTIQPQRSVDVSANAIGTITRLAVKEGQAVRTGDLLLEIDPTEYESAVRALEAAVKSSEADLRLATASVEKAEQDYAREQSLHDQGLSSEEKLSSAWTTQRVEVAKLEAAQQRRLQQQANLDRALYDLGKVTITAPMSGLISRLNVEEGENAIMGTLNNPGTVLLTIADLSTMEAWVEVDETEVVQIQIGQSATVEIDAFPDRSFPGVVSEIGNSPIRRRAGASREAVEFDVKITLEEAVPNVRPGLTAKADITVAASAAALAVPLEAVTVRRWPLAEKDIRRYTGRRGARQKEALAELGFAEPSADTTAAVAGLPVEAAETEGVFLVRDEFVKFVPVTLGIAGKEHFELLSGVEAGQTAVSGPFRILRELQDGTQVQVTDDAEGDAGRGGEH